MPDTWEDISEAACAVLAVDNASGKATTAREVVSLWRSESIKFGFSKEPSLRPGRPSRPLLISPADMPRRRKAGNDANRCALLHAVAHIELNAIDLAFDIVARFGASMPRSFTDDWLSVGEDEARHFTMVNSRLKALGSFYGDLPAHDGLWQSAMDTADNLGARLAIVPMVLEARGLDVTPSMIKQFERTGDTTSAEVLQTIYDDEIGHVKAGSHWFKYVADKEGMDAEKWFHTLVGTYFHGHLKPPFNVPARTKAGMPAAYYEPLAIIKKSK